MSQDENHRAKLTRLADALMEDIIASSDADIIADVDASDIERARTILEDARARVSKQLLGAAKAELDAWRSNQLRAAPLFDRTDARERFEKIRRSDAGFDQKMLLAARNGQAPTDSDKEGLAEDLADLQRWEDEDPLE
jgi:hypothetical protein